MLIYYHHRTLGDGAEGIHIREMIAAFRQLGHTVKVFGPVGEGQAVASGKAGRLGRLKRAMPAALFELCEISYTLISFFQLWRAIRKERPAFIYDRYITFNAGPVLVAKFTGVPIFLEVNAPLALERSEEPDETLIFRWTAFSIERWVCTHASRTIVVSTPLKDYLVSVGVPGAQCIVLPNGVDPVAFAPRGKRVDLQRQLGISEDDLVVGFTGVLRPWHGLDLLARAVGDLVSQGKKVFLLIVGDGPVRASLELSWDEMGLSNCTKVTGRLPYSEVPDYVSLFDVAVSPKATFYASPMKVVEYMSLSKAVVVPHTQNFLDIVDGGVNGLTFSDGCEGSLAEVIGKLYEDRRLILALGINARQKVLDRLNWKWNASKIEGLMEKNL